MNNNITAIEKLQAELDRAVALLGGIYDTLNRMKPELRSAMDEAIVQELEEKCLPHWEIVKEHPNRHPLGMTDQEVKEYIGEEHWPTFCTWIAGQTCPVLPGGICGYYPHDVEAFKTKLDTRYDRQKDPAAWD